MIKEKLIKFLLLSTIVILILFVYFKFLKKDKIVNIETTEITESTQIIANSNIISNVKYTAQDAKGNKYTINAKKGEIDLNDINKIFLTEVNAIVELKNSENLYVRSDYGKYNILNYDTIFSKNVRLNYQDNQITADNLDFSIIKNLMILSKNVIYKNLENTLYADTIEINIQTKDTAIYMNDTIKKVKVFSNR